jgi:prepilin-type N-terminal cleavage/methylation domain-containing protein
VNSNDQDRQRKQSKKISSLLKFLNLRVQTSRGGFTLLETIIALVLIGILSAIMAPAFLAWLNNQRLNSAQSQVETIFRQTQSMAKQQRIDYQASFRQHDQKAQWAIHPAGANLKTQDWQTLNESVKLLESPETTLPKNGDVYKMVFNHRGEVSGRLGGRVTLALVSGGLRKRCVIVSNLLGKTRLGENRPQRKGNPCD